MDKNFRPLGMSAMGRASEALVFVGYGLSEKEIGFDEYKGLDVAGKIVVVLRRTPPTDPDGKPFAGGRGNQTRLAAGQVVDRQAEESRRRPVRQRPRHRQARRRLDGIRLLVAARAGGRYSHGSHSARATGFDVAIKRCAVWRNIERDIDREVKPHSVPLTGWSASLDTRIVRKTVMVKNIIGVLEGKGPLAKEIVVIGAHYDHLGRGERGSLERDPKRQHMIHHGADDNGSGTVSVIELARRFASRKDYQGRTIVFMNFAGEEQGLLGSRYFCGHPTIPLDHVCTMVNLDMVGRLRADEGSTQGKLEIGGIGSARSFAAMVDELNKTYGFKLAKTTAPMGRAITHRSRKRTFRCSFCSRGCMPNITDHPIRSTPSISMA